MTTDLKAGQQVTGDWHCSDSFNDTLPTVLLRNTPNMQE